MKKVFVTKICGDNYSIYFIPFCFTYILVYTVCSDKTK